MMLDPLVIDGHGPKPCVLIACLVSVKDGGPLEDTCLLGPGDHPFIQHDSYVDYRFTRVEQVAHVQKCINDGSFDEKEPCSPALIKRILQGALKSRRISREYKMIIEKVLFPG